MSIEKKTIFDLLAKLKHGCYFKEIQILKNHNEIINCGTEILDIVIQKLKRKKVSMKIYPKKDENDSGKIAFCINFNRGLSQAISAMEHLKEEI